MGWANQGTETAALVYGGGPGGDSNNESYDGTCWTELANLNTAMQTGAGAGISTLALYFGGANPGVGPSVGTESWNGTSWTEVADMATGRGDLGGCGTSAAAIAIGGPPGLATTEVWNDYSATNPAPDKTMLNEGQIWYNTTGDALKYTINTGAWASGTTSPAAKQGGVGFGGAASTALMVTGNLYPPSTITVDCQTYNGSAWTEIANVNTGRKYLGTAGPAAQTAGLIFAGGLVPGPGTVYSITESWNGTSWTEVADVNSGRKNTQGSGTQTAALIFGGDPGPQLTTELLNGTSWAEVNDLNSPRAASSGLGTSTASLCVGGDPITANVEKYDGTSWSEQNNMNTAKNYLCAFGISTSAIATAGAPYPSVSALTESWDGTSWTEVADLATGRWASYYDCGSSNTGGLITSGIATDGTAVTEEWAFSDSVKTVTVS